MDSFVASVTAITFVSIVAICRVVRLWRSISVTTSTAALGYPLAPRITVPLVVMVTAPIECSLAENPNAVSTVAALSTSQVAVVARPLVIRVPSVAVPRPTRTVTVSVGSSDVPVSRVVAGVVVLISTGVATLFATSSSAVPGAVG